MSSASVVTGIGVVAPNGVGTELYWDAVLAGKSGIGPLNRIDGAPYGLHCAGQADDFDPATWVSSRLRAQTDRWTQLAMAATAMAVADAGLDLDAGDGTDLAVYSASSAAGSEFGQHQLQLLWSEGPEEVSAYQSIAWFYAATTGQLSIKHGVRGPCGVVVTEQAGGLDVLDAARRAVVDGARAVLAGGTEAPFCPYNVVCVQSDGQMSPGTDPATAYRPFDPAAQGAVPGEGGAFVVVEPEESAAARGAEPYAWIAGHASTFDPPSGGSNLGRAARLALADAGIDPADVDVVLADGAGVPELDRREAGAITEVFGPSVAVTVPKTMTGRLFAGGAALDAATAALALREQVLPPTVGAGPASGYGLALVTEARAARLDVAVVLARGRFGFNSALVLTR
jgi:act minimal PKS chain-length factor (CLF/KS beta)